MAPPSKNDHSSSPAKHAPEAARRWQAAAARLGDRVREQREALGLTQEALAERAGIHDRSVGVVERGESNVTLATLVALAAALEMPLSALFVDPAVVAAVSEVDPPT